ncbi:MAG: PIN domain-containing protein [Armatimonadota bacterium]|nr:PIN domain-containing protein [Armatimonadota bacterium]
MLLDTSGLLCCFDKDDWRHPQACAHYNGAPRKITHSYVLAEVIPLCLVRRLPISKAIAFLRDLLADPTVEVIWVDQDLHELGLALLEARPDKKYSLCDAVSFVLMHQRGLYQALTTDDHFEQESLQRLLPRTQAS